MVNVVLFSGALPEFVLSLGGLCLLLVGVVKGDSASRMISFMTMATFVVTGVAVICFGQAQQILFSGLYVTDPFVVFAKLLVLAGSGLALMISIVAVENHKINRFEFPILILFATLGMLIMISANDLLTLFLGVELQGLSLYILAAFKRDDVRSTESGIKYFILGALSTAIMLYGISLIYGFTGTTNFAQLKEVLSGDKAHIVAIQIGMVLLIVGLLFKLAAVPFHMWTPDVYEGAPSPVTAFFATAAKIGATAMFIRVMFVPFANELADWTLIVAVVAIASVAVASFAAVIQTNIKRLLGYSSIAHTGFGLVALAAGTVQGVQALLVYLVIYLITGIGAFAIVLIMRRQGRPVEQISDLAGFGKTHPLLAASMAILMFSMAGIPPMAGFFAKLYVFIAAFQAKLYLLGIATLAVSVVGAYYYLRIVKVMYFDEPEAPLDVVSDKFIIGVSIFAVIFTLLFAFLPGVVLTQAEQASVALLGH